MIGTLTTVGIPMLNPSMSLVGKNTYDNNCENRFVNKVYHSAMIMKRKKRNQLF
jgi:hypothetical protein